MKKNLTVLCTLLVLGAPLASVAQPGGPSQNPQAEQQQGPQGGQHQGQQGQRGQQGQQNRGQQPGQAAPQNRPQQQGNPGRQAHAGQPAYRDPNFRPQAGMPVPHQQWQRGRVVDQQYRDDRYWVTDWRARQLSAPPRDHRWLRINGDYVLVAIATGVITTILTGY